MADFLGLQVVGDRIRTEAVTLQNSFDYLQYS